MKVLVAGGGTGGHVYPGIALVEAIGELYPDAEFLWVGTRGRVEEKAVPRAGIEIEFLKVPFLKGKGVLAKLGAILRLPGSGVSALRLVGRFKPDVVVGLGGFVSGPVAVAARLRGVPVMLLEQNAHPGIANRMNARFARRIYATFPEAAAHFPDGKTVVMGNPVRKNIAELAGSGGTDGDGETTHILVVGGSQGAQSMNRGLPGVFAAMSEQCPREFTITHATGRGKFEDTRDRYARAGVDAELIEYIDDMATQYRRADLVVCRAGATTISELTIVGLPAIYVPFPHAADDHQTANARSVVDAGGGALVPDAELGARGAEVLTRLLQSVDTLAEMGSAAARLGRPTAAADVANDIIGLVGSGQLQHVTNKEVPQ